MGGSKQDSLCLELDLENPVQADFRIAASVYCSIEESMTVRKEASKLGDAISKLLLKSRDVKVSESSPDLH